MAKGFRNITYYFGEVKTILKLNGLSSFLSIISLALIFFITALTLSGWWMSTRLTDALKGEAEISAYFPSQTNVYALEALSETIEGVEGVRKVTLVSAQEAYERMASILGQEARILTQFDDNPFESYFEINIDLDKLDSILTRLDQLDGLDYVRDNRSVLDQISQISNIVGGLGFVMIFAVGISTFIITSHIIREGVHNHKDQINTLQLLGAPDRFIHMPFFMEGGLLTVLSGVIAAVLFQLFGIRFASFAEGVFPFLPSINGAEIMMTVSLAIMGIAVVLGFFASAFGLKMVKTK